MVDSRLRLEPSAVAQEEWRQRKRRLGAFMIGRLVVTSLVLGGVIALLPPYAERPFTSMVLTACIVGTYAASILFAVLMNRSTNLTRLAALQLGWDLLVTTVLVYVAGGFMSGFTFLYGASILMAALTLGTEGAALVAGFSLTAYLLLGSALRMQWIPPPPDQPAARIVIAFDEVAIAVLSNLAGLVLVTVLAASLASRLRVAGGQLRASEKFTLDVLGSLRSGLLATSTNDIITMINPAGAEMFRSTPKEMLGKRVSDFVAGIPTPYRSADAFGRGDSEAIRSDGTRFPLGFTRTPLLSTEGQSMGTLLSFQDLSEIAALREAAERAERLATLGTLAATLAHEIRNPLGSIAGSVELVRDNPALQEEDKHLLEIVGREVDRLNELVTTMIDLGKPHTPTRTPTDCSQLVREVCVVASRGDAQRFGVNIVCEVPEGIAAALDGDQIRQVLWNLIKNALAASTRGQAIVVSLQEHPDEVVFSVSDSGPGIAISDREKIFDLFHTGRTQGAGIGLALVRQITLAHGGHVEIDGKPGQGAMFRVHLPKREPHD